MIKLILFDFDGTIADTFQLAYKIYNENAEIQGLPKIKPGNLDEYMRLSLKEFLKKIGLPLYKMPFLIAKFQSKIGKDMEKIPIFNGMPSVIKYLKKKHKVGILSSNSESNIRTCLKAHNLQGYFDFVIGHPHIFGKSLAIRRIFRREGLTEDNVIYIGDEVRDIIAAKKAGVRIISVSWGFNLKDRLEKESPNWLIDDPKDLRKIISKL